MKTTVHIVLTALFLALPFKSASADATNASEPQTPPAGGAETVIENVVERMPAETATEFDALMQELADSDKEAVEILATKLVPATEGQNSKVEYALNGLVAYVSAEGREALAAEVRSGLRSAIGICSDKVNKAFLMTLLQLIGTPEEASVYEEELDDDYLKPFAISGLTAIQAKVETTGKPSEGQTPENSEQSHERINALYLLLHSGETSSQDLVLEALLDSDREYRAAALREAEDFANENFYGAVAALMPKLETEAKADVVRWFGDNHVTSQCALVAEATSDPDSELAKAAIKAAGKIGGDDALAALAVCLEGPHGNEAVTALISFKGDITKVVVEALNGSPETQIHALELAGARHIRAAAPKVFELTGAAAGPVREAAYEALAGVCRTGDFDRLCALHDGCGEEDKPAVRAAIVVTVQGLSAAEVEKLKESAFGGSETAFFALLNVKADLSADLLALAGQNATWKDAALLHLCAIMDEYVPKEERVDIITKALDLQPSADAQKSLLTALGDSHDPAGISIALSHIDDPETAEPAAYAIKTIAGRNADILTEEEVRAALVRAREVYSALSASDADAGYAVDEIDGLLAK